MSRTPATTRPAATGAGLFYRPAQGREPSQGSLDITLYRDDL